MTNKEQMIPYEDLEQTERDYIDVMDGCVKIVLGIAAIVFVVVLLIIYLVK